MQASSYYFEEILKEWPSLDLVVSFLPLSVLIVITIFVLTSYLKKKYNLRTNYTRKIIHMLLFLIGWCIGFFIGFSYLIIYGVAIALVGIPIVILGEGNPLYEAVARPEDNPNRSLFLILPYITSVLGALCLRFLVFDYYFIGILVAGVSDAVAEPIGVRYGHHRYRVPSVSTKVSYRSIEGSFAVFTSAMVITFLFTVGVFNINPVIAYFVSLISGLFTAIVEAISPHGLDNFTVQLSSALPPYLITLILS
ncbi:MAG: hypothetical protein ACP6IU_00985 [Candidatus Asgardarchaeia archaeon]